MPSYRLRCLGDIRIANNEGGECTPRARKTRALLVYVLLAGGTAVMRDRLATLLWGDRGEEQARASVRQALYELRNLSSGAAPLLTVTREHVSANVSAVVIDLDEAEALARAADVVALTELLRGQQPVLFADLDDVTPDFDDWLRAERSRRLDRLIAVAVTAGQADLARGEVDRNGIEAVRSLAAVLEALDPLSEPVVRLGIQADTAAGDPAQAHRRYRRFEERLARDLATQPSTETRALLPRSDVPTIGAPAVAAPPIAIPAIVAPPIIVVPVPPGAVQGQSVPPSPRARAKFAWLAGAALIALVLLASGITWFSRHSNTERTPAAMAQERYQLAQTLMRDRRESDLTRARTLLLEAVDMNPEYAQAWATLAIVTMLLSDEPATYGPIPLAQARNQALHYANTAVKLDPNLATGYAALGLIFNSDERSIPQYQRAIALDPTRAEYHRWLGQSYANTGRSQEALTEFYRAAAAEPLWPSSTTLLIEYLQVFDQQKEMDAVVERFNAASTDANDRKVVQFIVHLERGELAPMVSVGRELLRERPDEASIATSMATVFASLGDRQSALTVLQPNNVLLRAIISHDLQQIERIARESPGIFWHEELNDSRAGELLVASGRGKLLLQLFDARYGEPARVQSEVYKLITGAPALIVALRDAGREAEASHLNRLILDWIHKDLAGGATEAAWAYEHAQQLALAGEEEAAIQQLQRLLQQRWTILLCPPFVPLTDLAAFRALRSDPRLIAIQHELDTRSQHAREQIGPF